MLLEAESLMVRYGNGALGISDVSIAADSGEIVAILGPAGAGKTTSVRAMSGILHTERTRVVRGCVRIDGHDLTNREPHTFARAGVSFIPETFDRQSCDEIIAIHDPEAFTMVKRLAAEEGLLSGSSGGAIVEAAVQIAVRLGKGKRVATIIPDSAERYLSKKIFEGGL